jgi:hypothetical protein
MRWTEHVAHMRDEKCTQYSYWKIRREETTQKIQHRLEEYIRIELMETG